MTALTMSGLTNAGRLLLAKAAAAKEITFSKIVLGDGYIPSGSTVQTLERVVRSRAVLDITKVDAIDSECAAVVHATYTNQNELSGFYYRELGLYAIDPDVGEILYCYGNSGDYAEWIPPTGGVNVIEKLIVIRTVISPATDVKIYVNPQAYATVQQYEDYMRIVLAAQERSLQALQFSEYALQTVKGIHEMVAAFGLRLNEIAAKAQTCWDALFSEVSANMWTTTFNTLEGVTLESGNWNATQGRLEC